MSQKIGTDEFFRKVDADSIANLSYTVICADCAHDNCHNCKFQNKCEHEHYWDRWLSVAQIESTYPDLHWNQTYGMWEDSSEGQGPVPYLPFTRNS